MQGGVVNTELFRCYYPYLVSLTFAVLLSLYLVIVADRLFGRGFSR